jgi:hypothetical protein
MTPHSLRYSADDSLAPREVERPHQIYLPTVPAGFEAWKYLVQRVASWMPKPRHPDHGLAMRQDYVLIYPGPEELGKWSS